MKHHHNKRKAVEEGDVMHTIGRVGVNFLYKMIVFPTVLDCLSCMFPHLLYFSSQTKRLLAKLFMAIGLVADETVLPKVGNTNATLQGSIFMTVVIKLSSYMNKRNHITWRGAILVGLTLGCCEYVMHRWLLKKRGTTSSL